MIVTIVRRKGESLLVEYQEDGRLKRVLVPATAVSETGEISAEVVEMGIPYGEAWASMIQVNTVTAEDIEDALHRSGVWTADDLRKHPQAAVGALQQVYGIQLAVLLAAVNGGQNGNSN